MICIYCLFKRKAKEDQLLDIVDKCSEDMQLHGLEAVNMMGIAAWCLQVDSAKRPSLSTVVKVSEGVMDVEVDIDYNFLDLPCADSSSSTLV
ncbi:hypothetical protein CDL15_Pgr002907 [Punica granatum]|uniref:Serine-threonine/tyrosine-protein kinase catalytic domain-containing protein n=1 Tax=Punica granatum TaxID=22663 RepID=A0A218X209_PUNGR|nr:hypothetical protein CDL15_Pgr002907 [Punica granatum]